MDAFLLKFLTHGWRLGFQCFAWPLTSSGLSGSAIVLCLTWQWAYFQSGYHFYDTLHFLSHFSLHFPNTNTAHGLIFCGSSRNILGGVVMWQVIMSLAHSTWSVNVDWNGMGRWCLQKFASGAQWALLLGFSSCCALARRHPFSNVKHKSHLISDMNSMATAAASCHGQGPEGE